MKSGRVSCASNVKNTRVNDQRELIIIYHLLLLLFFNNIINDWAELSVLCEVGGSLRSVTNFGKVISGWDDETLIIHVPLGRLFRARAK